MNEEIFATKEEVAKRAVQRIVEAARAAVTLRGRFLIAVSGGEAPLRMLRLLANEDLPWALVHLFQVDERIAPADSADRNLTNLRACFLAHLPVALGGLHPMPVEKPNAALAAVAYAATLYEEAGDPPVLDLVHLGLGADGHTASLLPGDSALEVTGEEVALTGPYQGHRRITLTYPPINRARSILWVVTGNEKAPALDRLRRGDPSIPAGSVQRHRATVLSDASANATPTAS